MRRLLVPCAVLCFLAAGAWPVLAAKPPAGKLAVTSSDFAPGAPMPRRLAFRDEGENVSPALAWNGAPAATRSFAIACWDPDAPREKPWVHWVLYDIPATARGVPSGVAGVGTPGKNDFGKSGWGGPLPPRRHGVHHYRFHVYALDTMLKAGPGLTREELARRIEGHVLAEGLLVGTYERK